MSSVSTTVRLLPAQPPKPCSTRNDGRYSHKIVGVPGTVHGMVTAHKKFGKLPWKQLLQPAITLARDGFPVDRSLASSINSVLEKPKHQIRQAAPGTDPRLRTPAKVEAGRPARRSSCPTWPLRSSESPTREPMAFYKRNDRTAARHGNGQW